MPQLYTIGHSTYPEEHFLELIKQFDIDYVLDVRSVPFSRFAPQYNSDYIKTRLKSIGVGYTKMGYYFGARRDEIDLYHPEGYLDFEKVRATNFFQKGIERVMKGLQKYNLALMCTEKDPINCHRTIMVSRGFELNEVSVMHIRHDKDAYKGHLESQDELNRRLLDTFFPEREQLSIFQTENLTDDEYIKIAYRKQNQIIGYRMDSGQEGGIE